MIWVGTSGYNYPEWKGSFYPDDAAGGEDAAVLRGAVSHRRDQLHVLPAPTEKILDGWSKATPEPFKLTLKAPKRITHDARLRDCGDRVRQFLETAATLGPKLGALLFQLPPNLKKDVALFDAFLDAFPPRVCAAFEFRHVVVARRRGLRAAAGAQSGALRRRQREAVDAGRGDRRLRLLPAARRGLHAGRHRALGGVIRERRGTARDVFVYFKHEEAGKGPEFAPSALDGRRSMLGTDARCPTRT